MLFIVRCEKIGELLNGADLPLLAFFADRPPSSHLFSPPLGSPPASWEVRVDQCNHRLHGEQEGEGEPKGEQAASEKEYCEK